MFQWEEMGRQEIETVSVLLSKILTKKRMHFKCLFINIQGFEGKILHSHGMITIIAIWKIFYVKRKWIYKLEYSSVILKGSFVSKGYENFLLDFKKVTIAK